MLGHISRHLRVLLLFLTILSANLVDASPAEEAADLPVSEILSLAAKSQASGSMLDALAYYGIAVHRDPKNYLTYFRRGAAYLSTGRAPQALADFDKVLSIRPGFEGALNQRAKLRARGANWKGAREDYLAAKKDENSEELVGLQEAENAARNAKGAAKKRDWDGCVTQASTAIMTAVGALDLRNLRVRCRFEKGEVTEALNDLQAIQTLNSGAVDVPVQVAAMMYYSLGELDRGLDAVKKCLRNDPDSKRCNKLFKKQKKIQKTLRKAEELESKRSFSSLAKILSSSDDAEPGLIEIVKEDMREYRHENVIHPKAPEDLLTKVLYMSCNAYIEMNNLRKAQPFCTDLLAHDHQALPGLLHKAQAQLDADDFEGATQTLNAARDAPGGQQNRKVQELIQKAQKLLKQSKTKDYYKVLELSRDASDKDIRKAFRRLSKINHPDKVTNPEARPAAEKKMAAINEAYEVLADPDLKQRYDNGEDPNDPTAGHPQGGNPFEGGGNPFAGFGGPGGGQQFVFRSGGGPGGPGGGPFQFQFPGGNFFG
ncbi:MAG: hypothetical protein Q9162_003587 [Coniocarpon cinnabarinum]